MLRLAILFTLLFPGMARLSLRADEAQEPAPSQGFRLHSAGSSELEATVSTKAELRRFVKNYYDQGIGVRVFGEDGQPYNWISERREDEELPSQRATFVKMALPLMPPMPERGVKLLDGANNDSPLTGDGAPREVRIIKTTSDLRSFVTQRFGMSAYLEVDGANYRIPSRWEIRGNRVPFVQARVMVPQLAESSKKTPRPDSRESCDRPVIHDELMKASHNGTKPITFEELEDCLDREPRGELGRTGLYRGGRLQARSYWNTACIWQETMVKDCPEFELP